MSQVNFKDWMQQLLEQQRHSNRRQLVVFQGSRDWCDGQLADCQAVDADMLLLSNRAKLAGSVLIAHADACLGSESSLVTVDLFEGFNADVLCIAAGLVKAGGVLLLFSPPLSKWSSIDDIYALWQDSAVAAEPLLVEYFFEKLEQADEIGVLLGPNSSLPFLPEQTPLQPTGIEAGATLEQQQLILQLQAWVRAKEQGVALLCADRGRGKSSCLGLLVQTLAGDPGCRIIVTAASRKSAARLLQVAGEVDFIAPDLLIQTAPAADLLIVDEAAMIPQSMLKQLCRLYTRLIMATTTGGYEGTGQGFLQRFIGALPQQNLLRLSLIKPVRWCEHDPLEAWFKTSLLPGEPASMQPVGEYNPDELELLCIEQTDKRAHRSLLLQVYALLVSAHYRTRPSDLRMLLENSDLLVVAAVIKGVVVAAALLNREGGFDAPLCAEVYLGRRRPRGHLLAQMLTAQAGIADFASYRGIRVQRIAVVESCRRQGIGKRLLEYSHDYASRAGFDYLGASFALDPLNVAFWQKTGFELAHVSFSQGKSSGNQSLAVVRAISAPVVQRLQQLQQRIQRQLNTWMTQFLQGMEAADVISLLRFAGYRAQTSDLELRDIVAFARGNKGFELCFASLQPFVMQAIAESTATQEQLLVEKLVQNRHWENLERENTSEGRAQLLQRLRRLVDELVKD